MENNRKWSHSSSCRISGERTMNVIICGNCGDVFEPENKSPDEKITMCKNCEKKLWWT